MRNRNEAPAAILAGTEVFDYLKEKVGERKTRTEAYCDLLDNGSAAHLPIFKETRLRPRSLPVPCDRFRPCIRVALASRYRPLVSGHARSVRAVGTYPAGEKHIITMHLRIGTPDMPDSQQKETDFAARIQGILYDWVIGKATSFDVGKSCGRSCVRLWRR